MKMNKVITISNHEFIVTSNHYHFIEITYQNKKIKIGCEHYQGKKSNPSGIDIDLSSAFYDDDLSLIEDEELLEILKEVIKKYYSDHPNWELNFK